MFVFVLSLLGAAPAIGTFLGRLVVDALFVLNVARLTPEPLDLMRFLARSEAASSRSRADNAGVLVDALSDELGVRGTLVDEVLLRESRIL